MTVVLWVLAAIPVHSQTAPGTAMSAGTLGRNAAAASAAPSPDAAPAPGLNSLAGLPVREIGFRGPAQQDFDHLRALLEQKTGQPLDKQKLRRSIQHLFATGRFSDIQVEADRSPQNELTLVFVAKENSFVGPMTMTGAPSDGPNNHQLLNTSKLVLGELFTDANLQRALQSMQRALRENGYYEAKISNQLIKHPDTQQTEIHFVTDPGPKARIGRISIEGDSGLSPAEAMDVLHMHPGNAVTSERLDKGLQRLRKRFLKQDRLEAQVSLTDRVYHADSDTLDYSFTIRRGPTVDVRLEGASLRKGLIKRYIPVYEENAVDDDLLNEGRSNLRDYFQSRGYFDAKVTYTQKQEPERLLVVYDIDRGLRHKLAAVDVDWTDVTALPGNQPYFSAEQIREHMQVQPAGRLFLQGLFSQSLLARDTDAITALYRSNGFERVKVTGEVQDDYQGERGRMRVLIHVQEGPQTRVASLNVTGNSTFPTAELLAANLINTQPGQPWSDATIAADRESVMNFYFNHGFPEVALEARSAPSAGDPTRMDVTFKITEGKQVFVNHILLSGLQATKGFVVGRELRAKEGDPLSQSAMVESQRRLYDLGIFNEVNVAVENPDGDDTSKNLLFDLKEARRWTFNYGLGLEVQTGSSQPGGSSPQGRTGISPRVSFDLTRINFRGRDHTILFKTHVGRLEQRALFTYEAPRWFDRENLKLSFISFYDNANDIRTFTSQRLEGAFQIEDRWSRATTLLYRFSYREVKATNLVIDPLLIPLYSKPARIGMPTFTYIRDTRDNPLDSHRGMYTAADVGVSSKYFGSQASFLRFLLQNSTYYPFRKKTIVLARSTRFGIEDPINYSGSPLAVIPLPELLFAGGGNSHRGFSINQAGPRDLQTGFPLGGEAMFINNVELRLPPPWLPLLENKISPVIFYDYGNVFGSATDLFRSFFKVHQNNPNCTTSALVPACDFNFMAHSVGGGIRYNTPIGPVRLDLGYNLNPPTFLILEQGRTDQLRHLNFFFSIGQTF